MSAVPDWMSTKKTVVAWVLSTQPDSSVQREVRTFSTMTADLLYQSAF
jgi:hypothetical protein